MRDPKRIYAFCNKLAEHWSKVPDWRFGQLLSNVLGQELKKDLFYPEEDEMMGYFDHFFEAWDTKTTVGKIVNNHVDVKPEEKLTASQQRRKNLEKDEN